jgi:hypothetical protein
MIGMGEPFLQPADEACVIANEHVRARAVGMWEMKRGRCRNIRETIRGGSCPMDGMGKGRGKSMVQTMHGVWEGDLRCTRINRVELYRKYGSNNKRGRTIKI